MESDLPDLPDIDLEELKPAQDSWIFIVTMYGVKQLERCIRNGFIMTADGINRLKRSNLISLDDLKSVKSSLWPSVLSFDGIRDVFEFSSEIEALRFVTEEVDVQQSGVSSDCVSVSVGAAAGANAGASASTVGRSGFFQAGRANSAQADFEQRRFNAYRKSTAQPGSS